MYRSLDNVDRQLVALLETNARMPATELAKRAGLARSTIHERIARLERRGIILGYSAIVRKTDDAENTRALIYLNTTQKRSSHLLSVLESVPEIRSCFSTSGSCDLVCWAEFSHLEDLDALLDEIALLPSVERVESSVMLASKFEKDSIGSTARNATGTLAVVGGQN